MDNTASTAISTSSILKIKDIVGRNDKNFEIIDFKTLVSDAAD